MLGIFRTNQSKTEYAQLKEEISNLEIKISNLFKNLVAAMIAAGTIGIVLIVTFVLSPLLTIATLTTANYPFHAVLVKTSVIWGIVLATAGLYFMWSILTKCYEIIKKYPV